MDDWSIAARGGMGAGAANAGPAIDGAGLKDLGKLASYASGSMNAKAAGGTETFMLLAVAAMYVTWLSAAGGPMSVEESTGVQGVILLRSSDGSAPAGGRS